MKTRRVFVTLEVESDRTVKELATKSTWSHFDAGGAGTKTRVLQAQANVARSPAAYRAALRGPKK